MSEAEKALRFELDQAGIERREAEAVELVELRAEVARLRHIAVVNRHLLRTLDEQFKRVSELEVLLDDAQKDLEHSADVTGLRFPSLMLRISAALAGRDE